MDTTSYQSKLLSSVGFSFFDSDELEPPLRAATTPPVLSYIGKTPIEPQKPSTERRKKKAKSAKSPQAHPHCTSSLRSRASLSLSLSLSVSLCLSVNFSLYLSHARSELDNGFTPPALRRSIRAGVVRGLPPHCCLLGDGRCDQDVLRS